MTKHELAPNLAPQENSAKNFPYGSTDISQQTTTTDTASQSFQQRRASTSNASRSGELTITKLHRLDAQTFQTSKRKTETTRGHNIIRFSHGPLQPKFVFGSMSLQAAEEHKASPTSATHVLQT